MKQLKLLLLGILSLPLVQLKAYEVESDGIIYYYESVGDASVIGYIEGISDVVIKEYINGHKVTSIGNYYYGGIFSGCLSLTSVVLPDNLEIIGSSSFYGCSNLSSVTFGKDLKRIDRYAFYGCYSLRTISFPEGLERIGECAFYNCTGFESIQLPESIESMDELAFGQCENLKEINIPQNLTVLQTRVFEGCTSLESLEFHEGFKRIEKYAFSSCEKLKQITIPYDLEFVDESTYSGSSGYTEKIIIKGNGVANYNVLQKLFGILKNDGIIMIDSGMYDSYASVPEWARCRYRIISADMLDLRTVELTANENESALYTLLGNSSELVANLKIVGSINGYDIMALRNKLTRLLYLDLTDANIVANDGGYEYYTGYHLTADNVLGDNCFCETKFIEVQLPKSLKGIGAYSFSNCNSLSNVVLQDSLYSIGDNAFYWCEQLKDITLPNSLTEIGQSVFYYCRSLGPTIIIPDKVESIKQYTFYGCDKIESVHMGKGLKEIGRQAFYGCRNLRAVSLPYSVEIIDNWAFYDCISLKSIQIPSMTKTIGDKAFYGCDDIDNIYTYTVEPTVINQNTFTCFSSATLNVPKASIDLYQYNTQWSQFQTLREFDEPYDAFYLNGDLHLTDISGRLSGEPDAQMYETSGIVVEGQAVQELKDVELTHNGRDGGTIIGAANDVTGSQVNLTAQSLKVNISVDGSRWYFFCFPFDVEHDSIECTAGYVFYTYDGSKRANDDSGWTKLASDFEQLQKGVGYIFRIERTGILTIHVGSEYLTFTAGREREVLNEYASADATNAGWNMIGNPFISYYDVQDLAHEYDAPIVIWNGYGYDAYKPGDDDYQLKPFEAFFVQKETGASYVEFLPENRMTYNQAATRSSLRAARRAQMGTPINLDRQLVNIVLMGQDSITDRTRIVYSTSASMDYEIGVDAAKFQADGVPQLYTLNGKTKYAINERPMGTDEIKVGYTAPKAGTYTLSVPRHDAEVEIYDNVAKSKVDFTFGDYSFQSQAGTFNDRFVVYKTSGGVTKVDNGFRLDGMTVKTIDGGIVIEGNLTGKVQVYSESGMLLAEPNQPGFVELADGVYVVRVVDKNVKLFVK